MVSRLPSWPPSTPGAKGRTHLGSKARRVGRNIVEAEHVCGRVHQPQRVSAYLVVVEPTTRDTQMGVAPTCRPDMRSSPAGTAGRRARQRSILMRRDLPFDIDLVEAFRGAAGTRLTALASRRCRRIGGPLRTPVRNCDLSSVREQVGGKSVNLRSVRERLQPFVDRVDNALFPDPVGHRCPHCGQRSDGLCSLDHI